MKFIFFFFIANIQNIILTFYESCYNYLISSWNATIPKIHFLNALLMGFREQDCILWSAIKSAYSKHSVGILKLRYKSLYFDLLDYKIILYHTQLSQRLLLLLGQISNTHELYKIVLTWCNELVSITS